MTAIPRRTLVRVSGVQKRSNTNLADWFVLAIRDTASVLFTNIVGSHFWILQYPVFSSVLTGHHPRLHLTSRRTMAQVNFPLSPGDSIANITPPRFLKNLKLVAVDELHYYHGMFGRYVHKPFSLFTSYRHSIVTLHW